MKNFYYLNFINFMPSYYQKIVDIDLSLKTLLKQHIYYIYIFNYSILYIFH